MSYSHKPENREFVRISTELPVEFKFIGDKKVFPNSGGLISGTTPSLSGGGMMVVGPLPDRTWIPRLIMQKIIIGVKFHLPGDDQPVVALCRVVWIKDADTKSEDKNAVRFGLKFKEISFRDRDRIFEYVIHNQMEN